MRLRNSPDSISFILGMTLIILLLFLLGITRGQDRTSTPSKHGSKLGGPVTCCYTGEYTRRKKMQQRQRRKRNRRIWLNIYKKQWSAQYNSLFPQRTGRAW